MVLGAAEGHADRGPAGHPRPLEAVRFLGGGDGPREPADGETGQDRDPVPDRGADHAEAGLAELVPPGQAEHQLLELEVVELGQPHQGRGQRLRGGV